VSKFYKSKTDGSVFKNMFVGMDVHKNYLQVAVLTKLLPIFVKATINK